MSVKQVVGAARAPPACGKRPHITIQRQQVEDCSEPHQEGEPAKDSDSDSTGSSRSRTSRTSPGDSSILDEGRDFRRVPDQPHSQPVRQRSRSPPRSSHDARESQEPQGKKKHMRRLPSDGFEPSRKGKPHDHGVEMTQKHNWLCGLPLPQELAVALSFMPHPRLVVIGLRFPASAELPEQCALHAAKS